KKIIYHEKEGLLYLYEDAVVEGEDIYATGDSLVYDTETNAVKARGRSTVKRKYFDLTSDFLDYNDELQQGFASGDVIWTDSSVKIRNFTVTMQFSADRQTAKAMSVESWYMFECTNDNNDTLYLISDTFLTFQTILSDQDSAGVEISDTTQDFTAFYD